MELAINNTNLQEIMDRKQQEVGIMAKELAEREWELFELNLFVSSFGKKYLQEASKQVQEIKAMAKNGEINLEEFERSAEEI
jgi:hypothetical protein